MIADMRAALDARAESPCSTLPAHCSPSSTAALVQPRCARRPQPAAAEVLLLVFPPTCSTRRCPKRAAPTCRSAGRQPAFDRLQVEDYDWLTAGADANRRAAYATVEPRLGYPPRPSRTISPASCCDPDDRELWRRIDAGIDEAREPASPTRSWSGRCPRSPATATSALPDAAGGRQPCSPSTTCSIRSRSAATRRSCPNSRPAFRSPPRASNAATACGVTRGCASMSGRASARRPNSAC